MINYYYDILHFFGKVIFPKYKWHIILTCFLGVLSIYIGPDHAVAFRYDILRFFCSIVFCLTFVFLLHRSGWIGYLLIIPIFIFVALQAGYRFNFGERISKSVLSAIVETSQHETKGVIGNLTLLFFFSAIVFAILIYIFHKLEKLKKKNIGIVLILASLLLITTPIVLATSESDRFIPDVIIDPPVVGNIYYDMNNLFFGDAIFLVTTLMLENVYSKNYEKTLNKNVIKKDSGVETVVLVIGESSLSKRYSAYGYHLPTSPEIEKYSKEDGGCIVKNVHSSAPITRDSISMTLSFATPENSAPLFNEKSIIDMAKENGYKTYWLSSQPLKGRYETRYGFLVKDSDKIELTDWNDNELPVLLQNILTAPFDVHKKKFVAIQMNGSHVPYTDKFDAVDTAALPNADNYDKSIHKTDRIISIFLKLLEAQPNEYVLLFASDHGEIVNVGHGITRGGIDQYLIPMFMRGNSKNHEPCSFVEKLRNENGYINALSNKFILSKILGYSIEEKYLKDETSNDRVLHSNGLVYSWADIVNGNW